MKIIFNNDCRCFKKGETIELNFVENKSTNKKNRFLFLIGDNGCGKSTILKALRKYKTTMTTSFCGGQPRKEKNVNLASEIKDIANDTTVEGLDGYECIDALDGELDNPNDWGNCGSATDYVENGGYVFKSASNGTRAAVTFIEWLKVAKQNYKPGSTLILLDEIERGWGINYCAKFVELMDTHFVGCDFIVITHNPICCLSGGYSTFSIYYDVEAREYVKSYGEYFTKKTDKYITFSCIDLLELDKEIIEDFKKKNTELKEKLKNYEKADEEVGMPQSETDEGNQ